MERHYFIAVQHDPDHKSEIGLTFKSEEPDPILLEVKQAVAYDESGTAYSDKSCPVIGFSVDCHHPRDQIFKFPDVKGRYTHMTFIVRNTTFRTEHKVDIPFGQEPIYTDMRFS